MLGVVTTSTHDRTRTLDAFRATFTRTLGGVGERALALLEREVEPRALARGDVLIEQGSPGDCLYFVTSGLLRVAIRRDDGAEVRLGDVHAGESVGEMALLTGEPRSAAVVALTDCEVLRLSRDGFDRLLAEHPQTMRIFTALLVERLEEQIRARSLLARLRVEPLVSDAECAEIVRTPDLVLRNLKITEMYHRLSLLLTILLGREDANWCTFASHASRTAGFAIRGEELPAYELVRAAAEHPRLGRVVAFFKLALGGTLSITGVGPFVAAVTQRVSDEVSAGNLAVFAELAPLFARFVRTFHRDAQPDGKRLAAFLETLAPGRSEAGGQDALATAFARYHEAAFERDAKRRAELVLLGNVMIGLHEQIRLQPHIRRALDASVSVGRRLDGLQSFGRRLLTRRVMRLRLPTGALRLGYDVPFLRGRTQFPDVLQQLDHPDLAAVVGQWDRDVTSLRGSAAVDWGELAPRMNFIVDLFRSRQRSHELFEPPLLWEQRVAMSEGRVPSGRL